MAAKNGAPGHDHRSGAALGDASYRQACSYGNACTFAPHGVVPVATPGVIWRVPGMLLNPLGPLAIVWRYLPQLTLSALTGYLVSQLVGQRPAVDLTPLRPDRFKEGPYRASFFGWSEPRTNKAGEGKAKAKSVSREP
ncbi:hypothetical protein BA011_37525 (plasmid) [Rhizobium leguminosarum]|uniref:Uncharacterized protein n=1 Tax=Rhizobium leguminosarum TaxID=384 RepID=A0A1B1CNL9_RHILE|nr:hypothetical protein [Rhizobium leguminosarum]ANP91321.1 hypothetical protein BA011_37525 [Rhizobium leguminosarum]